MHGYQSYDWYAYRHGTMHDRMDVLPDFETFNPPSTWKRNQIFSLRDCNLENIVFTLSCIRVWYISVPVSCWCSKDPTLTPWVIQPIPTRGYLTFPII